MSLTLQEKESTIYFKQLDGLRCLAVLSVLICHWITYRAVVLIPLGSMGVNLFFVLSGFLITRILLVSKSENTLNSMFAPIKTFYVRRTLRIFPVYYLTVFVLFVANYPAVRHILGWLLTYTFNIKFALPNVWESGEVATLAHLWSLSVEEQFYIFFPFLIFLIPQTKMKGFIWGIICLGVASRFILYITHAPLNSLYVLTPCCFDAFGAGSLLAYYILYQPDVLKKILSKNYIFIAAVVVFIVDIIYSRLYINGYGECRTVLERFFFSLCCFWIVGKAAVGSFSGYFKKFLENRYVIYLGKISYGIYIYHFFAQFFFDAVFLHFKQKGFLDLLSHHMILRAILLFTATLIASTLSWYFIEQPINRLKSRFTYNEIKGNLNFKPQ